VDGYEGGMNGSCRRKMNKKEAKSKAPGANPAPGAPGKSALRAAEDFTKGVAIELFWNGKRDHRTRCTRIRWIREPVDEQPRKAKTHV